jgi:hypothetical protein
MYLILLAMALRRVKLLTDECQFLTLQRRRLDASPSLTSPPESRKDRFQAISLSEVAKDQLGPPTNLLGSPLAQGSVSSGPMMMRRAS